MVTIFRFLNLCEQYDLVPAESRTARPMDAQTKRELKIQRFQKEKQSTARLKEIGSRHGDSDDNQDQNWGDEDVEREAWLIKIDLAVLQAAEQSNQIEQVPVIKILLYIQFSKLVMSQQQLRQILYPFDGSES